MSACVWTNRVLRSQLSASASQPTADFDLFKFKGCLLLPLALKAPFTFLKVVIHIIPVHKKFWSHNRTVQTFYSSRRNKLPYAA